MIISKQKDKIVIKSKTGRMECGEKCTVGEFELSGPGEYEISGIEIQGLEGGIYLFSCEDIDCAYLDSLKKPLPDKEKERLTDVNVLIIPVGENGMSAKDAVATIKDIEPNIAIPLGEEKAISQFCHEFGGCGESVENLKISQADLEDTENKVVVIR